MIEIKFGKDRYHLNGAMEVWCAEHIGPGGWVHEFSPKTWEGLDRKIWVMHSMFGNTTFLFKNPEDATLFALRWA
jgi:hypothetical protein